MVEEEEEEEGEELVDETLVQIPFREQSDALVHGRLPSRADAAAVETRRDAIPNFSGNDVMLPNYGCPVCQTNEKYNHVVSKAMPRLLNEKVKKQKKLSPKKSFTLKPQPWKVPTLSLP